MTVTLDSQSSAQTASSVNDLSWTHTAAAPQDAYLLVAAVVAHGPLGGVGLSCTYGAQTLSILHSKSTTTGYELYTWGYQGAISTSATTIDVHVSAGRIIATGALVLNGVSAASTAQESTYAAGATSAAYTASPGAAAGGLVVTVCEALGVAIASTTAGTEVTRQSVAGGPAVATALGDSGGWTFDAAATYDGAIFALPFTASTAPIQPTGIAAATAFGTATLTPGAVTLSPLGLASGFAAGNATLGRTVSPAGIAATTAFGTAMLTLGSPHIVPNGIASGALGVPTLGVVIAPPGLAAGALGQPGVASVLAPGGLAAGGLGAPAVTSQATASPSGLASTAALGTPALTSTATIALTGLAAGGLGTPVVGNPVGPSGVASTAALGTPALTTGPAQIWPTGIPAGGVGTPAALIPGQPGNPIATQFTAAGLAVAVALTGRLMLTRWDLTGDLTVAQALTATASVTPTLASHPTLESSE